MSYAFVLQGSLFPGRHQLDLASWSMGTAVVFALSPQTLSM
jgi:hypothetical protein